MKTRSTISSRDLRDFFLRNVDTRLDVVIQREDDPLYFEFHFKPGYQFSERLVEWFKSNNVPYFVAQQGPLGGVELGGVSFEGMPEMAVLFKLEFC